MATALGAPQRNSQGNSDRWADRYAKRDISQCGSQSYAHSGTKANAHCDVETDTLSIPTISSHQSPN
jgi:hypothetical protein